MLCRCIANSHLLYFQQRTASSEFRSHYNLVTPSMQPVVSDIFNSVLNELYCPVCKEYMAPPSPSVWVATTSATTADRQCQDALPANRVSWTPEILLWRICRWRWSFRANTVSTGARTSSLIMRSAYTKTNVPTFHRSVQWTTWGSKWYALGLELPKTSRNTFRQPTRSAVRITMIGTCFFCLDPLLSTTATSFCLLSKIFSVIAG